MIYYTIIITEKKTNKKENEKTDEQTKTDMQIMHDYDLY